MTTILIDLMLEGFRTLYILNHRGKPIPEDNVLRWAKWFEAADRRVGLTEFGFIRISTVFLGIDYNWDPKGPPILWETMIFDRRTGDEIHQERCAGSWEQAEAMHEKVVRLIQSK